MSEDESIPARKAYDAIHRAATRGEVDQETVNWVSGKAFGVFRMRAHEDAARQIAEEEGYKGKHNAV